MVPDKEKKNKEKNPIETKPNEGIFMTNATVQKWGNSLAVRISSAVAERVGISQGTQMELRVEEDGGVITLVPKKPRKKYSLEELLSKVTPENRHEEIDFGIEGNELI